MLVLRGSSDVSGCAGNGNEDDDDDHTKGAQSGSSIEQGGAAQ
jgi:hypothetical protein